MFKRTGSVTRPFKMIFKGLKKFSRIELEHVSDQFGGVIRGLSAGSHQVSMASREVASGASEQSASIEETSSSMEELSSMTKANAGNAEQADKIMEGSNRIVRDANHYYTNLIQVPGQVYTFDFVAFTKKLKGVKMSGWDSLTPYRVAVPKGWVGTDNNVSDKNTKSLVRLGSPFKLFKVDRCLLCPFSFESRRPATHHPIILIVFVLLRNADRVRTRHGRRIRRLHDDPANPGAGILGRDQQIHMPEHPPARFVQNEAPRMLVVLDEATLLPNRVAGRRRHAPDNHIPDFTFRVAINHMNDL